jgi:hypothetical protein
LKVTTCTNTMFVMSDKHLSICSLWLYWLKFEIHQCQGKVLYNIWLLKHRKDFAVRNSGYKGRHLETQGMNKI